MRTAFGVFFALYAFGPLVGVPAYAYFYGDWFLLFGMLFAYFGVAAAFYKGLRGPIYLFTLACIGAWFGGATIARSYLFFFLICAYFGLVCCSIAEAYDQESKRGTLANDDQFLKYMESEEFKAELHRWTEENPGQPVGFEAIESIRRTKLGES